MVTVFGRQTSSSVQLVMWALEELAVDYERLDYGHGFEPTTTKEFLSKNPMGRIPVLEDGSVCMFESAAILRYLGAKYGDAEFWPSDPDERSSLDTWAEWGKNTFTEVILRIFGYEVRMPPESRDVRYLQQAAREATALAQILNDRLADQPWVGGEHFTFADIACGHILYRYFTLSWDRPDLPALDAYYQRLQARPAYRQHVMVSYESLIGSY